MMNNPKICINERIISAEYNPYVIAEISANHNGDIRNAFRLIDKAVEAGADAVKLQTYTPDTITIDCDSPDFRIEGGLWNGKTLYELYGEAHLPWEWHAPLFKYAREKKITIFSSPFDRTAVDLLEDLNAPAYKIASFEMVDLPLIRYVASTRKPIIISTGMADEQEINEALEAAREGGCNQLALLHCVSGYPAPPSDYNLKTILDMREKFQVVVGLSDHTIGNINAITSVAFGVSIIEKHFTLDRLGGGPDDSFSIEPLELSDLCRDVKIAHQCIGKIKYGVQRSEKENLKFRRSLYFIKSMLAGEKIKFDSVRSVRPGFGLSPKYFDKIIGATLRVNVAANTPVSFDQLELN